MAGDRASSRTSGRTNPIVSSPRGDTRGNWYKKIGAWPAAARPGQHHVAEEAGEFVGPDRGRHQLRGPIRGTEITVTERVR